jgi:hypothetical protein
VLASIRGTGRREEEPNHAAAAGGVTGRAVLYVLFFLAGAPLLLGLILAAVPAILGRWGLLPT